jgi:hypothetical protein
MDKLDIVVVSSVVVVSLLTPSVSARSWSE